MARKSKEDPVSTTDPNHGHGGSYVNGEDGVRRLVERTKDQRPRSADEVGEPQPETPTE